MIRKTVSLLQFSGQSRVVSSLFSKLRKPITAVQYERSLGNSSKRLLNQYSVISPEKQQAYEQYFHPKKRNWTNIIVLTLGFTGTIGYALWFFFWPHHTFSKDVAKKLRQALWAESNKEDFNYRKALKLYVEALQIADDEHLSPLSDEYTGIQIKIAEMYEKLGLNDEASLIYHEISDAYLAALTNNKVPIEDRPHILLKDLRVVVKFAQLNTNKAEYLKVYLLTHLLKAQEEVLLRLGVEDVDKLTNVFDAYSLKSLRPKLTLPGDLDYRDENSKPIGNFIGKPRYTTNPYEPRKLNSPLYVMVENILATFYCPKASYAWKPFVDEFFNARDLFVSICMLLGDRDLATRTQISTTHWMMSAECEISDTLRAFNNCGSMLYLTAEEYEAQEINLRKHKNYDAMRLAQQKKVLALGAAFSWFSALRAFYQLLPTSFLSGPQHEPFVKVFSTAVYSTGVILLHIGKLDDANRFLREARLRAKSIGYTELAEECDSELLKLEKERQNGTFSPDGSTRNDGKLLDRASRVSTIDRDIENIEMTFQLTNPLLELNAKDS